MPNYNYWSPGTSAYSSPVYQWPISLMPAPPIYAPPGVQSVPQPNQNPPGYSWKDNILGDANAAFSIFNSGSERFGAAAVTGAQNVGGALAAPVFGFLSGVARAGGILLGVGIIAVVLINDRGRD